MSKNRKQQLSRSLAKLVSIWLVNQINDFLWVFMNQFFCPFRLRNPYCMHKGKMKLMMIWTLYFKGIKNTNRWNIKAKKKREWEKDLLHLQWGHPGALLYSDETLILMRVVSSRLPVPWMICEHYVNHMLKISVLSDNAVCLD